MRWRVTVIPNSSLTAAATVEGCVKARKCLNDEGFHLGRELFRFRYVVSAGSKPKLLVALNFFISSLLLKKLE
jgi:hypothetical protein